MKELNVNEIEQVNGGNARVAKKMLDYIGGGLFFEAASAAFRASFPGPRTPRTRGQMGRNG